MWTTAFYHSNMKQNSRHWIGPSPCELNSCWFLGKVLIIWLFPWAGGGGVFLRKGRPVFNKRRIMDVHVSNFNCNIFSPRVLPHAQILGSLLGWVKIHIVKVPEISLVSPMKKYTPLPPKNHWRMRLFLF